MSKPPSRLVRIQLWAPFEEICNDTRYHFSALAQWSMRSAHNPTDRWFDSSTRYQFLPSAMDAGGATNAAFIGSTPIEGAKPLLPFKNRQPCYNNGPHRPEPYRRVSGLR